MSFDTADAIGEIEPGAEQQAEPSRTFTRADGLAWLGISRDRYDASGAAYAAAATTDSVQSRVSIASALLDAHAANSPDSAHARSGIVYGVTSAAQTSASPTRR